MYHDDLEYAQRRLNNTLVRLSNGHPFMVLNTRFNENFRVVCEGEDLKLRELKTAPLTDIDLTPVPLGFVNAEGGKVAYVSRKPMRRDWKQGLSNNSISVWGDGRFNSFRALVQPILKEYPSFARALEQIQTRKGVAFSRDFALINSDNQIKLFYRKYEVGVVVNRRPVLNPDKFYLEQHLNESVG